MVKSLGFADYSRMRWKQVMPMSGDREFRNCFGATINLLLKGERGTDGYRGTQERLEMRDERQQQKTESSTMAMQRNWVLTWAVGMRSSLILIQKVSNELLRAD
jgi:hypothetical protein